MRRGALRRRDGFTLIEVLVVVALIGVLVVAGINQYLKAAESQKAELGSSLVSQVAHANLMHFADRSAYVTGALTNTLCNGQTTCPSANGACSLVTCGYLARRNFDKEPYLVWAGNGSSGSPTCGDGGVTGMNPANVVACGRRRKNTDTPSAGGTSDTTYQGWAYAMSKTGAMTRLGTGSPEFSQ